MPKIDTVVVGASAGGVESLSRLVAQLPKGFPAAVLVVIHFPERGTSVLPHILARNGNLPAVAAEDDLPIENGTIYCAPPGRHLLIRDGHMNLVNGPKENGNRPAIDPLFRTAAHARRNRVVSVLLSGLLDDGTMGTWAVRRQGGVTICQDPEDALFGDMPRHAIETGSAMHVLPLDEIGAALERLAGQDVSELIPDVAMPDPTEMTLDELAQFEKRGQPSPFVCPECQGTLFEFAEEGVMHYRCRVGHSYLPDSLAANQEGALEAALWTALRALEEHNDLLQRMLSRAESRGFEGTTQAYRHKLEEGAQRIGLLRHVLGLGHKGAGFDLGATNPKV